MCSFEWITFANGSTGSTLIVFQSNFLQGDQITRQPTPAFEHGRVCSLSQLVQLDVRLQLTESYFTLRSVSSQWQMYHISMQEMRERD